MTYMDLFEEILPRAVAAHFLESNMNFNNQGPDILIWKPNESGIFTLKSAFHLLRRRHNTPVFLNKIWNNLIPLKVSVFSWRFVNRLLPMADNLYYYGFHGPSRCWLCLNDSESVTHTFWECRVAAMIWNHFSRLLEFRLADDLWGNLQLCWMANNTTSAKGMVITLLPSLVLWELWKARNGGFFEGRIATTGRIIAAINQLLLQLSLVRKIYAGTGENTEILSEVLGLKIHKKVQRRIFIIAWQRPPEGILKLNIDGSFRQGKGGSGYVIRDHNGDIIEAGGKQTRVFSAMEAEVSSLLHGLARCIELRCTHLIIESDSSNLIQILKHKKRPPWILLESIGRLLSMLSGCSFALTHIYREGNSVAHLMADWSHSSTDSFTFTRLSACPQQLRGLLLLDKQGIPYLRTR